MVALRAGAVSCERGTPVTPVHVPSGPGGTFFFNERGTPANTRRQVRLFLHMCASLAYMPLCFSWLALSMGTSLIRNNPFPEPPWDPGHIIPLYTVGFQEGGVSYERGTPVIPQHARPPGRQCALNKDYSRAVHVCAGGCFCFCACVLR
jgi:hypothetical protein